MSRASLGEQHAIDPDQINGNHSAYGADESYISGASEADLKGVNDVSPAANGPSPYRDFGFAICDPDYRNSGLPPRDGHKRTDVE